MSPITVTNIDVAKSNSGEVLQNPGWVLFSKDAALGFWRRKSFKLSMIWSYSIPITIRYDSILYLNHMYPLETISIVPISPKLGIVLNQNWCSDQQKRKNRLSAAQFRNFFKIKKS